MEKTTDVLEQLREAMDKKEFSYCDLERLSGIPKSAIQRYLSGKTQSIPYDRILSLCKALGVDPLEDYPPDMKLWMSSFSQLNAAGKEYMLEILSNTLQLPKYTE